MDSAMQFAHLSTADLSDVGRKRKNNEDAAIRLPDAGVFCVADGMGGVEDGEVASSAVVRSLKEAFAGRSLVGQNILLTRKLVQKAAIDANRWIRDRSERLGKSGTGSTVVVISFDNVDPKLAVVSHAGDSRAYRFRAGELKQISKDHSVAAEAGILDERKLGPMFRALVTRAVGVMPDLELEETAVDVLEGDLFLLCSDGLTTMLRDEVLQKLLRENSNLSPTALAQLLVNAANQRGGLDNVTVLPIRVGALPSPGQIVATPPRDEARPDEIEDATPASDTAEPIEADSSETEARISTADLEGVTPTEARAPLVVERDEEGAPRDTLIGPLFNKQQRRTEHTSSIAIIVGCAIVIGVSLLVWRHFRDRDADPGLDEGPSPPTPHVEDLTADLPEGPLHSVDDGPVLSQIEIEKMRKTLPTLIDGALETGDWGYIEKQVKQWSARIDGYLEGSGRKNIYVLWLDLWKKMERGDLDPAVLHYHYRQAVVDVCSAAGFDPPPRPRRISWKGRSDLRAGLYCRLVYRLQNHVTHNVLVLVTTARAETAILGPDPDTTLTDLWYFVGNKNERSLSASRSAVSAVTNDVTRLALWLNTCNECPIPALSIRNAPGAILPRLVSNLNAQRKALTEQLKAIPARLEFWRSIQNQEVGALLDEIGRMHKQLMRSRRRQRPAALWQKPENQKVLTMLFSHIAHAARVSRSKKKD